MQVRTRIGAWYALHEGLRSSGPTEGAYEAFILANDRPEWRHTYADGAWSCALRFLACCRVLGLKHALLSVPYEQRVGHAVGDAAAVARSYGALVEGKGLATYEPDAADAMCQMGPSGPHVSCLVSASWTTSAGSSAPARLELGAVDGGQGHLGDMAIGHASYLWTPGHVAPRSAPASRRPLVWMVDMWELILCAGLLSS